MAQLKLNQHLKIQINELKLFATNSQAPVVFNLDNLSFNIDEVIDFTESKERVITGRIFPNSDIYVNGAFQIEIKLPPIYPLDPPKVRFITPIYHPNVGKDGKKIYRFCFFWRTIDISLSGEFNHELLMKTARWTNTTSLVDVVKTIVERIDEPDINYSINDSPFLFLKLSFFL